MKPFDIDLRKANIPPESVLVEVQIGRRQESGATKWVVCVNAANSFAFQLPGGLPMDRVMEAARWVSEWDAAMASRAPISNELRTKIAWCAMAMDDCELRRIIDSAYPSLTAPA